MPIYKYRCDDCEEPFELFVRSVNGPAHAVCPKCGSEHIAKEVTAFATVSAGASSFASFSVSSALSG